MTRVTSIKTSSCLPRHCCTSCCCCCQKGCLDNIKVTLAKQVNSDLAKLWVEISTRSPSPFNCV